MKRFLFLSAIFSSTIATGCMTLTPVGPLAGAFMSSKPTKVSGDAVAAGTTAVSAIPNIQDAPPPPHPAHLIGPDDVYAANAVEAARQLGHELDHDQMTARHITPAPEVSVLRKSRP